MPTRPWFCTRHRAALAFALAACFAFADTSLEDDERRPIILVPGFASSRLRVSRLGPHCKNLPGMGLPLRGGVWVDPSLALTAPTCWLDCMSLEPSNQR